MSLSRPLGVSAAPPPVLPAGACSSILQKSVMEQSSLRVLFPGLSSPMDPGISELRVSTLSRTPSAVTELRQAFSSPAIATATSSPPHRINRVDKPLHPHFNTDSILGSHRSRCHRTPTARNARFLT